MFCPKWLQVIHTYTGFGGCQADADQHIRSSLQFSIFPMHTAACRPGELNQQPSYNKMLALPLNLRCQGKKKCFLSPHFTVTICGSKLWIRGGSWYHKKQENSLNKITPYPMPCQYRNWCLHILWCKECYSNVLGKSYGHSNPKWAWVSVLLSHREWSGKSPQLCC